MVGGPGSGRAQCWWSMIECVDCSLSDIEKFLDLSLGLEHWLPSGVFVWVWCSDCRVELSLLGWFRAIVVGFEPFCDLLW
jgi:hypothetical protein